MVCGSTTVAVLGAALGLGALVNEANAGEAGGGTTTTVNRCLQGTSRLRSSSSGRCRSVAVGAAVTEESIAASSAVVSLSIY